MDETRNDVKIEKASEYAFKAVSLSDVNAIKGLIKFRSRIDKYYDIQQNYNLYEAGIIEDWNEDLLCLYIDLDNLIKKIRFTDKQKDIIQKYMDGWFTEEITEEYNEDPNNIEQILNTICAKIKKQNDENWLDIITLNYIKTPYNYKQCVRCKEWKPAIEKYFSPKEDSKDGLHPYCKECR